MQSSLKQKSELLHDNPLRIIGKITLLLGFTFNLALFTCAANADDFTVEDYPAWRSAANHSTSVIKSIGSFTTESTTSKYPFRLRARAGVWFAAPEGNFSFGNNSRNISLENHLGLNDPEPSFTGDVTIDFPGQDDRWLLWFDAFNTSQNASGTIPVTTRANGTTIAKGTTIKSSFASTSFAAHVGYDLFDNILSKNKSGKSNENNPDAEIRIHAIAGIRALHLDQSFRAFGTGVNANYEEWHAILEAGARVSIILIPEHKSRGTLDISLNLTGGYGLTDGNLTTFDLFTAITWMPAHNLGLTAGYRLFRINLDNVSQSNGQPFKYDGQLAGFFLGGQLQF